MATWTAHHRRIRRGLRASPCFAALVCLLSANAGYSAGSTAVVGGGRIGPPVPGVTLDSPSDFGLHVDSTGGTFVCSMAGPATGGWAGTEVMLVQGVAIAGSLVVSGTSATFEAVGSLMMVPGPDGAPLKLPPASPPPAVLIRNAPFTVELTAGGPGQGSLVLRTHLTEFLGGDTGGIVEFGQIAFEATP